MPARRGAAQRIADGATHCVGPYGLVMRGVGQSRQSSRRIFSVRTIQSARPHRCAIAYQAANVIVTTHLPLMGPPKPIHTAHRLVAPAELWGW